MPTPWYKDGLRFTCTQCGDCCTGAPGFVWVDDAEIAAIAERLGEPVEQVRAVYTKTASRGRSLRERLNGDCIFFERGTGCTIYDIRPRQCRTWPFWDGNIRDEAAWKQTCEICPGSGQGELIPAAEIARRARIIPMG
jgi:Fe-S-cluster containining protein